MFGPELLSQLTALVSVVLIDIVLAGDNAVVVGTAAAGLPPAQQRKVIMLGAGLALVARVLFALVAVQLLAIIGLLLAGGILLLWVAWKIWRELHSDGHGAARPRLRRAPAPRPCARRSCRWRWPTSRCRWTMSWRSPVRRATTPTS